MGSLPESAPLVRVLIAGGSYTGLSTAMNLSDLANGKSPRMAQVPYEHHPDVPSLNVQFTIVDERDGWLHLIGCPLALADTEYSRKAWIKYADVPALQAPNVRMVRGSVSSVDPAAKTATVIDATTKVATTHGYDFFVAASGLRRVWPVVPQSLTRKQYLLEAEEHIHAVHNAKDGVVVVGGGAVGIEMAAELKFVKPDVKVTLVHSREKLLSSEGLPDECKDVALDLLKEAGVEVLLGHRLASTNQVESLDGLPKYEVEFTNGSKTVASKVIMAMSNSVSTTSYLPAEALDEEGRVKIQPSLHFPSTVPNSEYHFCGGDVASWSGIKRAGGAMHAGHYMAYNIHQTVIQQQQPSHKPKFMKLVPVPPMIGLAVGKKAVAYGPTEGVSSGEDVMYAFFKHDLGFEICWNWMQLGGPKEQAKV